MTLNEAYRTLGVQQGASKDEISKAFKKLAAECHPDSTKKPDEEKFKKINSAKQTIDNPPPEMPRRSNPGWSQVVQINIGGSRSGPKVYPEPVLDVDLTFEESVMGAKKKIVYDRYTKCHECMGQGFIVGVNICKDCHGQGATAVQQGRVRTVQECPTCRGTGKEVTDCVKCNGEGVKKQSVTQEVQLPFSLRDTQLIRGGGSGNYRGSMPTPFGGPRDVYGDALIRIHVTPDPDMSLDDDGVNLLSTIKLTLVDALSGINKKVRTLKGELTLKIRPGSKNGHQIVAQNYGPGYIGNHIFILDVEYPSDTAELIEFLNKQEN